ncbi:ornithine cyclodeaminase family protein [Macrococcus bovicus]|uniref:Ornithine cyclodeaminase family protein n=1 Tax=Macrococcus bovicus TaxID=69968 RepID=A0A4R6C034_9STAP|nr:ornithine cyclodeaminase family protein [Macrococcus bovicus]TDM14339.1 ornithine cyclodeaminase family protein [Macrococcus bovicus]
MKYYNDEAIQSVYQMPDAIEDIRAVLEDVRSQHIIMKERTVIEVLGTENTMLYMPCINTRSMYSIMKTISIFPENNAQPVSQGVTLLSELTHGAHVATLESSYLTRLRTGAMSAVATDHLAASDAQVLGVIGTGGMAFEQVLGVTAVRDIQTIKLYNRTTDKAHAFKTRLQAVTTADIVVCQTAEEAVTGADIINCATRSEEKVFSHDHLKRPVHINGVGSYLPSMREIDTETITQADCIVLDDIEGARHEAGEFIQAEQDGSFSFSEAVPLAAISTLPQQPLEITIFKSVGAAYYDLAVTVGAYQRLK